MNEHQERDPKRTPPRGQEEPGEDQTANEQMDEADRYATEMLRRLNDQLQAIVRNVGAALESLETRPEAAAVEA